MTRITLTPQQLDTVTRALASALVCLAGTPEFKIEEDYIRQALAVLGVNVVAHDGRAV